MMIIKHFKNLLLHEFRRFTFLFLKERKQVSVLFLLGIVLGLIAGPGFVRINFGCSRAVLEEALKRMDKAIAKLKK